MVNLQLYADNSIVSEISIIAVKDVSVLILR